MPHNDIPVFSMVAAFFCNKKIKTFDMTSFLLNISSKVLVISVLNISDKDLFEVSILGNDAALPYALLVFPLAVLNNLFNTIKFRR